jgi:hypothetical protein
MEGVAIPWEQPGWLERASAWIESCLQSARIQRIGPIDHFHIRPWSTVARVPTDAGDLYFKATSPVLNFEPPLTNYLAQRWPERFPDLIAIDEQHGWMLMRSSGIALRSYIRAEKSLSRWQAIMPLYAQLQKDTIPLIGDILALGVLDRRLDGLPAQFELLVADEESLLLDQPESLTAEEYHRLAGAGPVFRELCAGLVSFAIPETLHHDDFHDGNLFLKGERVIFTDWGECAVAHPFFSLVVMLRGAGNSLGLPPGAPELAEMRNWYLEQWSDSSSLDQLPHALRLAETIGLVNRALTWHRVISSLPPARRPEFALAVPSYLQEFINSI